MLRQYIAAILLAEGAEFVAVMRLTWAKMVAELFCTERLAAILLHPTLLPAKASASFCRAATSIWTRRPGSEVNPFESP